MVRIIYQQCFYKNRSKIKKYFEAEYKRLDRFLKKPEKVGKFPDDNDALIVDKSTISAMGTIENASPKNSLYHFNIILPQNSGKKVGKSRKKSIKPLQKIGDLKQKSRK